MNRRITTRIVWPCQGAGMHHPFYSLNCITITKERGGLVELYLDINEYDDGQHIPCGTSRSNLAILKRNLEALQRDGTFVTLTSNTSHSWPNELRIRFALKQGENFVRGSLMMCKRVLDIIEAHHISTEHIAIEHLVQLEVTRNHWVPQETWLKREADSVMCGH